MSPASRSVRPMRSSSPAPARGLGRSMAAEARGLRRHDWRCVDIDVAECDAVAAKFAARAAAPGLRGGRVASRRLFMAGAADFRAPSAAASTRSINNAMLLRYEPVEQISEETLDRMTAIGINGSIWGAQALLAHYDRARGGALINMASPVAEKRLSEHRRIQPVKGAIVTLTKVLAAELGPRNVRVNAIAPGSVPTPGALGLNDRAEYERRTRTIPLRRLGQRGGQRRSLRLPAERRGFVHQWRNPARGWRHRRRGLRHGQSAIPEFDVDHLQPRIRAQRQCGGRRTARVRAGGAPARRGRHDAGALRARGGGTDGLEEVFFDVAPVARPEFGAPRAAADRRSAEAHRRARGRFERAIARRARKHGRSVPRGCRAIVGGWRRRERRASSMPSPTSRSRSSTRYCPICIGLPDEGPRAHVRLRPHGVGHDGPDERAVPRGHAGHRRRGDRVGRRLLQSRESRGRQPRHGDVRGRRPWRGHAGRGGAAGRHPAVGRCRHHGDDARQHAPRIQRVSRASTRCVRADPSAGARRVRGEPALGFALAHGRAHRDARHRDRRIT